MWHILFCWHNIHEVFISFYYMDCFIFFFFPLSFVFCFRFLFIHLLYTIIVFSLINYLILFHFQCFYFSYFLYSMRHIWYSYSTHVMLHGAFWDVDIVWMWCFMIIFGYLHNTYKMFRGILGCLTSIHAMFFFNALYYVDFVSFIIFPYILFWFFY